MFTVDFNLTKKQRLLLILVLNIIGILSIWTSDKNAVGFDLLGIDKTIEIKTLCTIAILISSTIISIFIVKNK